MENRQKRWGKFLQCAPPQFSKGQGYMPNVTLLNLQSCLWAKEIINHNFIIRSLQVGMLRQKRESYQWKYLIYSCAFLSFINLKHLPSALAPAGDPKPSCERSYEPLLCPAPAPTRGWKRGDLQPPAGSSFGSTSHMGLAQAIMVPMTHRNDMKWSCLVGKPSILGVDNFEPQPHVHHVPNHTVPVFKESFFKHD